MSRNIEFFFDQNKKLKAKQLLRYDYISPSDLCGSFENVIKIFEEKYEHLKKEYVDKKSSVIIDNFNSIKPDMEQVNFESFKLCYEDEEYGDGKVINVYGTRDALPQEVERYNKEIELKNATEKERKRQQFEQLKKEFGEQS